MFAFLARIGIGSIVGQLAEAYKAREVAKTDRDKIAADERIKTLEARRDVMVAEGSPINAYVRMAFAVGPAAYYLKIFVWDKVLGWGSTDPLSPELTQISMIVIGFYFLYEGAKVVRRR